MPSRYLAVEVGWVEIMGASCASFRKPNRLPLEGMSRRTWRGESLIGRPRVMGVELCLTSREKQCTLAWWLWYTIWNYSRSDITGTIHLISCTCMHCLLLSWWSISMETSVNDYSIDARASVRSKRKGSLYPHAWSFTLIAFSLILKSWYALFQLEAPRSQWCRSRQCRQECIQEFSKWCW